MQTIKSKFCLLSFCLISCYSSVVIAADDYKKEKNEDDVEKIIVTGEGVARSELQTSSSLSVTTNKDIERRPDLQTLTSVLKYTPNILETGLGNELPTIRGIEGSSAHGATAFLAGARPRLNVQVDGDTSNYNELAYGVRSLWDIKQVEVFRGPQSYAQGRNAIAGAIVMQSFDPINQFEAAAKSDFGNQHRRQLAGMISGPLVNEQLLFRLSVDQQGRQSYEHLANFHPAGDSRKFKTTTTKAKLLWLPSAIPDFYSRLTFSHVDSRNPQGEFKPTTTHDSYRPVFKVRSASTILDTGYQFNDSWEFENKLIYSNFIHDRLSIPADAPSRVEGHRWQVAPTLKFNDGNYKGLLGLLYFNSPQDDSILLGVRNNYHDKTKTKAILGEFTFNPVDIIEVNLSARYEQENHTRKGGSLFTLDYGKKTNAFLPKVDVAYLISDDQRIGAKIARGYNPGGAGISFRYPFTTYSYGTEYVWNYELYHRWISEDKRLKINTNIFYNDYKDMQIEYFSNPISPTIANANKAITYGAEFNVEWQATQSLNLVSGIGLLKTKIKKYSENKSYNDNKLTRSPGYTINLGGYYTFPFGFETGVNTNFTDSYYSDASNNRASKINSYSQTNAYLAYNFKQGRIMLYADNIFNSRDKINTMSSSDKYTTYQQPRLIGVSAQINY
ncbi:TonB-dependent receptor [Gilliamella sp. wkB112]|uniref:TonB-dependent receptor n=1 Tax=Gilliamella sp. wkB112 TaxID=3120257 RepID=UPI00080E5BAE|nr:TonB-dependent receptor [Gilliamella apicola]OCG02256.1 hypothetical protein A9G12_11140 [Gilliamella apicola]